MNENMNQDMDKQNNGRNLDKIKASFTGRSFRTGIYVSFMSAIVLVIILVVNLITSKLDLKIDLSSQDLYTLTDPTLNLIDHIEDDITIYYLVESGKEAAVFKNIGEKYDSYSDKITFEYKDPILYPRFASEYVEEEISTNSFLVVNNSKNQAKYIANSELLIKEFDYNKLDYVTKGIDVEGKLTSAIQYVTSQDQPVLYMTTGHTEKVTGEVFQSYMDKQNVKVSTVATLTESIPEDSDILMINAPEDDFSVEEIDKIKTFMAQGGHVIMIVDYMAEELVNVKSLLEYYGIQMVDGIICEGDASKHVQQLPNYIVPTIAEHDITNSTIASKRFVIMPYSSGLTLMENRRSSLTIEPLFTTSDKAYSKINMQAVTFDKESGDVDGPFYLGLKSTDTYKGVTSNLIVYSSEYIFEDASIGQYGNATLLTDTIAYLSGDIGAVSVKTRTLVPESLYVTQQQGIFWGAIVIIILPVLILGVGILVTLKRRKR